MKKQTSNTQHCRIPILRKSFYSQEIQNPKSQHPPNKMQLNPSCGSNPQDQSFSNPSKFVILSEPEALFNIDGIVKSQKSSHSREGGNP
jgi:hypothetical protein